jgi:hypothetical protein
VDAKILADSSLNLGTPAVEAVPADVPSLELEGAQQVAHCCPLHPAPCKCYWMLLDHWQLLCNNSGLECDVISCWGGTPTLKHLGTMVSGTSQRCCPAGVILTCSLFGVSGVTWTVNCLKLSPYSGRCSVTNVRSISDCSGPAASGAIANCVRWWYGHRCKRLSNTVRVQISWVNLSSSHLSALLALCCTLATMHPLHLQRPTSRLNGSFASRGAHSPAMIMPNHIQIGLCTLLDPHIDKQCFCSSQKHLPPSGHHLGRQL